MKIWVIGRDYPTKFNRMNGSFEFEQALMLADAGNDVCYFAVNLHTGRGKKKFGFYHDRSGKVPASYFHFPGGKLLPVKVFEYLTVRSFIHMTEKAVKKYGLPDIIHVHYPALQPYKTFEYYQKQGVKIVATEHWTKVQDHTLSGANVRRLKDFAAKCDALLCVGSYLKTAIREITGTDREIMIVPNVANKLFRPAEKKHDGFRFFAAGRFVPVKQFDRIVSAFCKVFRDIPGVTLTIAGSGKEAENIKSRVTPEMADRVRFTGTVNRERMAQLTADADALISYSRLETFCVPVIEAWSCGIPAVAASSSPVMADYPDERLGIEVDCDKTETLEAALKQIYTDVDKYDPKWISAFAAEHFSEKAVSERLIGIYNSIM